MISNVDVANTAKQWQLEEQIIERDYVLGWLLWGIAKHSVLSKCWILKGGAGIKKCYVDTHRYSQDLDFTVLPHGPWSPEELEPLIDEMLESVSAASGLDFSVQKAKFELRPHGGSTEGKVYFSGPRGNPSPTSVKLDITRSEDLMRPPVLRPIFHPYPDVFPDDTKIYCYSFEELFAEKIRALSERQRPSDLFDIVYLFRRSDFHAQPELIGEVLAFKCDFKGICVPEYATVATQECKEEIEKRWDSMLGRGVGFVPDFEDYWNELLPFFSWLRGEEYLDDLEPIGKDEAWAPPPLDWQRGQGELLEPIRYAAVNRLLINLGYNSRTRLVEPYSLRLTRDRNILFYAVKVVTREIRSYRLDRVQSVEVTKQPFRPVFSIEFTPAGRIPVPQTRRSFRFTSNWRSASRKRYVVECASCGKRFYRERYSTHINKHKRKDGWGDCPGRHGYLV